VTLQIFFLRVPYEINQTQFLLTDAANTKDAVRVTQELFHNFRYTRWWTSDLIFHFLSKMSAQQTGQ